MAGRKTEYNKNILVFECCALKIKASIWAS
jgi:hypothetical protein